MLLGSLGISPRGRSDYDPDNPQVLKDVLSECIQSMHCIEKVEGRLEAQKRTEQRNDVETEDQKDE